METCLKWKKYSVPTVSILDRFYCIYLLYRNKKDSRSILSYSVAAPETYFWDVGAEAIIFKRWLIDRLVK